MLFDTRIPFTVSEHPATEAKWTCVTVPLLDSLSFVLFSPVTAFLVVFRAYWSAAAALIRCVLIGQRIRSHGSLCAALLPVRALQYVSTFVLCQDTPRLHNQALHMCCLFVAT